MKIIFIYPLLILLFASFEGQAMDTQQFEERQAQNFNGQPSVIAEEVKNFQDYMDCQKVSQVQINPFFEKYNLLKQFVTEKFGLPYGVFNEIDSQFKQLATEKFGLPFGVFNEIDFYGDISSINFSFEELFSNFLNASEPEIQQQSDTLRAEFDVFETAYQQNYQRYLLNQNLREYITSGQKLYPIKTDYYMRIPTACIRILGTGGYDMSLPADFDYAQFFAAEIDWENVDFSAVKP